MSNDGKFKPGQSGNPEKTFKPGNRYRWQPGRSGNPAGLARNRLRFEESFYASLIAQGAAEEAASLLWESARKHEPWAVQALLQRLAPETKQIRLTHGVDDEPTIDYTRLSNEELDQLEELDFPGTLSAVRRLSAQWPEVHLKLVEDKANGPAVIQSLRHQIGGLVEVSPEGGKISRAAAASPMLESGNWYLPHPLLMPWVEGFITECATFPAGANDDQVDAWTQGDLAFAGRPPLVLRRSSGGSKHLRDRRRRRF